MYVIKKKIREKKNLLIHSVSQILLNYNALKYRVTFKAHTSNKNKKNSKRLQKYRHDTRTRSLDLIIFFFFFFYRHKYFSI